MQFLEVPHRVMRTSSTEEFVAAEEKCDSSPSGRRLSHSLSVESSGTVTPPTPTRSKPWQYPSTSGNGHLPGQCASKVAIALCLLCILLAVACTVLTVLYLDTIPPYDVCRSKECTRTATLFLQQMDESVDPCTDFQQFACGTFLQETASTTSLGSYDHTTIMRDRTIARLRNIVENITDNDIEPLRQVKFMYDTCTDTSTIEDVGLTPLNDLLHKLIQPGVSLAKTLAVIKRETGQSYMFDFSLDSDYRNTVMNAIFIDQPQLPVDSSIFDDSDLGPAYSHLISRSLQYLVKVPDVHPLIKRYVSTGTDIIYKYDQKFSEAMSDLSTTSKAAMFNLFSLRELNRMFNGDSTRVSSTDGGLVTLNNTKSTGVAFNWTEFMTELFKGIPGAKITQDTHVIVNDLEYIKELSRVLVNATHEEINLYLTWQIIYSFGKDMNRDFRDIFYAFSQQMDGSESTPNRKTECINLMDNNIPFALTYRYILKFVPNSIIQEAYEMVENLLKAFKGMLSKLTWMDAFTKYRARLKADKMRAYMGYPKWMKNETALIFYFRGLYMSNISFFDNILVMKSWTTVKELKKFNVPVDPTWSSDSPAEADAFYDDELNAITFPSGFLQEPFFGMGLRSVDYGALGSVIGHEITHGFDTRGRYSDENGRLQSWWSIPTLMDFVRKAQCFVTQYSNYSIPELTELMGKKENHLNGKKTLAENIADNGGIRESFEAYQFYVKRRGKPEQRLPGLEKYSPDQLFFLSFAQSWCSYNNPASLMESILTNEHSPSRFRIIGPLQNFDAFTKTWKCSASAYMNPTKKCILW